MDLVKLSIMRPVGVAVATILLVMFGLVSVGAIPVQLTPTVDRPEISVQTSWPGRSPDEIVDEVTKEQEEQLKNLENLKSMRSTTSEGSSQVFLEFFIGTDIDRALQDVADKLRQVPDYPEEVEEPRIIAADSASENAIAWIILEIKPERRDDLVASGFDISTLFPRLDKEVRPYLERTPGVASVDIFGGRDNEVQVLINPLALAQRNLNHLDVIAAIRGENRNVSGGTIAEGKRDYRVRVVGQFEDPQEIMDVIVAYREGLPVYVRDIAEVKLGFERRSGFVRARANQVLAFRVIRQTGANVIEVMEGLQERLDNVRADMLPAMEAPDGLHVGPDLQLTQVYDETIYIRSSIELVTQNLWVGGLLAAGVLIIFLRSIISTGVIAIAIPVSVIGTFLVLLALGRTLNVVSLAGLAFAVGMVVDNAIVVLENIYRHRMMGEGRFEAAYKGGKEVWGAILASTLTTAAVFVPVLTIAEEAGQLFRDISIAIVASVTLSLIVSITVIPAACGQFLNVSRGNKNSLYQRTIGSLFGLDRVASVLVGASAVAVKWLLTGWRGWTLRPLVILVMVAVSLGGAIALAPPMDYLPAGNRNLVFGGVLIPPGMSVEQRAAIADRIESVMEPYRAGNFENIEDLPPIPRRGAPGQEPPPPYDPVAVDMYFIGSPGGIMFAGARSADPQVVRPIGQLLTNAMSGLPDAFGGAQQSSLFGRGVGGGNTIDIEISGPDLERVTDAAGMMFGIAGSAYGFGNVRPDPANFNLRQPEWQVRLNDRGRELGLTTEGLGSAVRALFDGAFAGEFRLADENVDLVLLPEGGRLSKKEDLASVPIATPVGPVVPLDTIVDLVPTESPQDIQRIEELASVTIQITPPDDQALEDVMQTIREQVIGPAQGAGLIDRSMRVRLEGTAAKLDEVQASLFGAAPAASEDSGLSATLTLAVVGAGALLAGVVLVRGLVRKTGIQSVGYGVGGALLAAVIAGGIAYAFSSSPELGTARMVWALIVTYLLMCALFESFIYPFVIMFSVPLAVVGGFVGLRIVHDQTALNPVIATQQLDVLTMLGFIILIGVVVNNAILIVHQALNFMRGIGEGDEAGQTGRLAPADAIAMSVKTRIRPIMMSSMTSVGGMLPLVLFPGAGSEMYRGLGSVVIGGLVCSTVFTLVLVPLVFGLVIDMREGIARAFSNNSASQTPPSEPLAGGRTTEPAPRELQAI
ncbi:MAG: efflux RND transporter permease subunit [Planctomycetota bacterium]